MLLSYFTLQYKMLNRNLSEFGLYPILGYFFGILSFLGISFLIFEQIEFAEYIYIFLTGSLLFQLSSLKRNDFLKSCFLEKEYYVIRLLENLILVLPFFGFLLFKEKWISAIVLLLISILLVLTNFNKEINYTVWTPFSKKPFEFLVGFRKTFLFVLFAYFLTFMSITVGNFNLGIFSLLDIFAICLYYYSYPENKFFVWIFSTDSKTFLFDKIKTALLHSTLLCLPITIGMSLFFTEHIFIILLFQVLGCLYLLTFILAKYSAYPKQMNLPQAILFVLSLSFPPLLFGVIPFLYSKSIKKLNEILT